MPQEDSYKLINSDDFSKIDPVMQNIKKFLDQVRSSSVTAAEVLTGFIGTLVSNPGDLVLSLGRGIQGAMCFDRGRQLLSEVQKLREKGMIPERVFEKINPQVRLIEVLKIIESSNSDEEHWRAVKNLFIFSISEDGQALDEVLMHQLFTIGIGLTTGQILILKAAYDIAENRDKGFKVHPDELISRNADVWRATIAKYLKHNMKEMILREEKTLIEGGLIYNTNKDDFFSQSTHYRLTSLGYRLSCILVEGENIGEQV